MAKGTPDQRKIGSIMAAITSSMKPVTVAAKSAGQTMPFVTISRQAGLYGQTLAGTCVDALNQQDQGGRPWHAFDRELVEKVAADHQISQSLIDAVAESNHSWINDVLTGMKATGRSEPTQFNVYRRVAETMIGLAEAGKAVIVGRGGANITQAMPGGVHVRIVAPLEYRISQFAKKEKITESRAAQRIGDLDENRRSFYTRFWGKDALEPERYTVTFNAARVSQDQMVRAILELIPIAADTQQAAKIGSDKATTQT